ncbi:MAG: hypothetical protein M1823_007087, partial [Watsoniomyces obsoletus]
CAECTRRGRPCVSLSWESINATRDNLREEKAGDEAEVERLIDLLTEAKSRLTRKRVVLEQAEGRARKKLKCLVEELEAEGEELTRTVINASAYEGSLFDDLPAFVDGTAAAVAGSSQGS